MDILKKDFGPNGSDRPSNWPNLTVTIISRYRCRRCKEIFSKTRSVMCDPNNKLDMEKLFNSIPKYLADLNNNRNQVHFCNHDTRQYGKFENVEDVTSFIQDKISKHESVEVGPADYLGSNIIKDKMSNDRHNPYYNPVSHPLNTNNEVEPQ